MFYLSYAFSELRRRRARTVLTAIGLAVGVALVVTVNALSTGLDNAQAKVLQPLGGVGTDMSVTRPLSLSTNGGGPFLSLTPSQRAQLRKENGGARVGFRDIAKPGHHFSSDRFDPAGQLTFSASELGKIRSLTGVHRVAGSLTLTNLRVSGTIPKEAPSAQTFRGTFGGPGTGPVFVGPTGVSINNRTVTGIDRSAPSLAPVTPGQITSGHYFSSGYAGEYQAVLSTAYAKAHNFKVKSKLSLGGKTFVVVGLATQPLGGTSSDIYVPLDTLQKLAGYKGQINSMNVEANSASDVSSVKSEITKNFSGAQVTTTQDLASRISGSLTDAKNLASKLGIVLEIVGLLAAVLIAVLLTLSSVAKRVREIGTLKAIGWSQSLVVRQISLESLTQGVLGGLIGAGLGLAAAAVISAVGITLKASMAAASQPTGHIRLRPILFIGIHHGWLDARQGRRTGRSRSDRPGGRACGRGRSAGRRRRWLPRRPAGSCRSAENGRMISIYPVAGQPFGIRSAHGS